MVAGTASADRVLGKILRAESIVNGMENYLKGLKTLAVVKS
jgi:hypothetical protein